MNSTRHIGSVLAMGLVVGAALAEPPPKTRRDIVEYAASAIDSPYVWGGANWDPDDRSFGGADCSGFVSKAWSIPRWSPYRVNIHGPSTYSYIITPATDWDEVSRSDLLYGDAIVYRYNSNQSGHIYLYLSGDGWGAHEVYEARGSDYGIVHRWRTAYSGADVTKGIRRENLIENVDVTEHIVETDDGAPYYTDSGMDGGTPYDSGAPGCRDGDCQYRYVTSSRNATCTYQPNLPDAGWYRIYTTCNESSPNVHDVGVTIDHALGAHRFLWDQADPAGLNVWRPVADASFLFELGTLGSVTWDNLEAWPTTGDHVFRGDATKFSLDNRVVVDGDGVWPGCFATLTDAIVWLRTHESEEPDVIRITCNVLNEAGCIDVDLWDDVTIEGDADGDGIPVTIVVTPGPASDWSRDCALYLDIPIQHHYTLRDIVLIPTYVSPGHATGAYGLVIDEQNPTGEACGMSLEMENVTIAGSLPGSTVTAPEANSLASATMFGGADANYGAAVLQRASEWGGDDACRQSVSVTHLTVTHSATCGLALQSAFTDWDLDGGLLVTYNASAGIKADHLDSSRLVVRDSSGQAPNRICGNQGGGGVNHGDGGVGYVELSNCRITANTSDLGAGVTSEQATTIIRNCILADNATTGGGGGILGLEGVVDIVNCTIVNNSADADGGAVYSWLADLTVLNSILWNNGDTPVAGSVTMTYSDVQWGYPGLGNIDCDPALVDPVAEDYHIRRCSPCVNEGDPASAAVVGVFDIDGETRVQAALVDMGADETSFWDGDFDGDGDVDVDDFVALGHCLAGPDTSPSPPPPMASGDCLAVFDCDEDGDVDLRDFAHFRFRSPPSVPDIVLEARDAGGALLPPPAHIESGAWYNSTAKSTAPGLVGVGSRYTNYDLPNAGTDNATFVAEITAPGLYEVFVTWGTGANCYDALYSIRHQDGETTLLVDQIPEGVPGANANTWVSLGGYRFDAGQGVDTGSVNVSEQTVSGKPHSGWHQRVYADAVKWVFIAR